MIAVPVPKPLVHPGIFLIALFRFTTFFIAVGLFILHHELVTLLIRRSYFRDRYFLRSVKLTTRFGMRLLNIHADYKDESPSGAGLFVSNHLSYIDILVLFSRYPSLFITSKEIGGVFLLGHLTKLAGCFHVERRKALRTPESIAEELSEMKLKLQSGLSLFLFPEGTSSDGSTVLPFKAHFFQTVIDLDLPVRTLCLKYDWAGRPSDEVCWYGDMGFAGHLWNFCCRPRLDVKVEQLEVELEGVTDRFQLANLLHEKIKGHYEKN